MTEEIRIRIADKLFLGQEFLTWLYFVSVSEEGRGIALNLDQIAKAQPNVADGLAFAMGKKLSLRALDCTGAKITLSGPGLHDNGEVLQAIRRGATIDLLSLEAALGSRVYAFTINSDGSFSGVKIPDLFTEPESETSEVEDPLKPVKKKRRPKIPSEDVLELRMMCLDELENIVDALFTEFLTRRLQDLPWQRDYNAIIGTVRRGLEDRLMPETAHSTQDAKARAR
jgi:hypothetical protein